jgi:hypothetical protein
MLDVSVSGDIDTLSCEVIALLYSYKIIILARMAIPRYGASRYRYSLRAPYHPMGCWGWCNAS